MDVTQSLKDTENALRDFIALVLGQAFGSDWIDKCGASPDRIEKWKERKSAEEKDRRAELLRRDSSTMLIFTI